MPKPLTPARFVGRLLAFLFVVSLAQRVVYAAWIFGEGQGWPPRFALAIAKGLLFDMAAGFFLFLPLLTAFLVLPRRWVRSRAASPVLLLFSIVPVAFIVLTAFGELFFFNEFQARYNFIAVDYLVYTHEVVRNIWESYPVGWALAGLFIATVPLVRWLWTVVRQVEYHGTSIQARQLLLVGLLTTGLAAATANEEQVLGQEPYWARELGKNTLFALFSAYRRNSISYEEFYPSIDPERAERVTAEWMHATDVRRPIVATGPERRWNVIVVIIESLSAKFLQTYGNQKPLTPNLDALAAKSLFFDRMYATGTRTVRGLEAIMLSVPPTPGQSILRRPGSDGLFNFGSVMKEAGYRTQFLYGGYSYFDNMKEWFSGNGFEIYDRGTFPSSEIQFANAWGVCDEDLFDQVLKNADELAKGSEPFMQAVLTTSNHRPYTYPDGRIDIPSHSGREGAVKYTDYAIGRFVKMAEQKPWFKNTLLVFVADHNAAVAGGTDIPVKDYLIPAMVYNPRLVPAKRISRLSSQIDLVPTLLALLGRSYESRFFGQNLLREKTDERAFLGTYQKVAYMTPGQMVILAPGHVAEKQTLGGHGEIKKSELFKAKDGSKLGPEMQETIALYQTASRLFATGRLKADTPRVSER